MKISKSYLKQIIKEELLAVLNEDSTLEEFFVGQIWVPQGREDRMDNKFALKVVNVLPNSVNVEIMGNGFRRFEMGSMTMLTKDSLKEMFTERSEVFDQESGHTKYEYTINLEESKKKINEGLEYHISNKTPLTENVYRVGSDAYFKVIKEARVQYKKGNYTPLNEEEKEMLESDLGEWATFREERVPLDFPMYTETLDERKKRKKKKKKDPPIGKPTKNTGGGKKYKVFVRNPKTGKIKKITYGDSQGGLKGNWNSAEARKSFASRHRCAEKKDRTKAGYWACRAHKDFGTNVPGRFW